MERLSPIDLERTQLPKAMRGYEPGAVDALVQRAARELEEMLSENKNLRSEVYEMTRDLKRYRDQETMLTEALVLAQKTADEVKSAAKKEAELIVQEARQNAADLVREADHQKQNAFWEVEKVRQQQVSFETRFREILEEHLSHLNRRTPDISLALAEDHAA